MYKVKELLSKLYSKLYIFEKIVIVYAIFGTFFMYAHGFIPCTLGNYCYFKIFGTFAIGFMMVAVYMFYRIARGFLSNKSNRLSLSQRLRVSALDAIALCRARYLNFAFGLDLLRISIAIMVMLVFFCNLKQIIPLVNPVLFDNQMWRLDQAFHFGISPTILMVELFKNNFVLHAMDVIYASFFLKNIVVPLIFILQYKSKTLRNQFITAICLCWIIGGMSYYLFPAMGPCYLTPGFFSSMDIPIAKQLQDILLECYTVVRQNPYSPRGRNFYGIAAMPSLHIAIVALFTFFARRLNRFLYIGLLIYLIFMFIGSILLGWHYAIDGYVGLLLAILIYFITTRIVKDTP
ncbi:MAG: phosphatase PAP2 family protein [Candidatus Omnitrophica bacterium]|nr:phosphatase PAP2 family protein [Candidatus Omnitrophota bacterium]